MMKQVVKSVGPIILQKLKKLISNRITQANKDSVKVTRQIKNLSNLCLSIREATGEQFNESCNSSDKEADNQSEKQAAPNQQNTKKVINLNKVEDNASSSSLTKRQKTRGLAKTNTNVSPKKKAKRKSSRIRREESEESDGAMDSTRKLL